MPEGNNGDPAANPNAGGDNTLENDIKFEDDERNLMDEATSKKVDSLFGQKKHWRDKHDKTAKEFEEYKKKHPEQAPEDKTSKKNKEGDDDRFARLELQVKYRDLDEVDLDKAIKLAKVEGTSPKEVLESDFFKSYLASKAEKKSKENATPSPSNRSGQPNSSSNYEGMTSEKFGTMTREEKTKYKEWLKTKDGGDSSGLRIIHQQR